jgi:predicted DNA-binding transcriptional regulator AlpA
MTLLARPKPANGQPAPPLAQEVRLTVDAQPVPIHDRLAWTLDDIAALLGVSRRLLERRLSTGRFPPPDLRVSRRVLWLPSTVREWLDEEIEKGRRR